MTPVFMFPGQSSRDINMFERLGQAVPWETTTILDLASHVLGRDLRAIYDPANAHMFDSNRNIQVGVFVANHVLLSAVERRGCEAELSLGLSLGEYNHLVHIGALSFEDALRLVDIRGTCYDQGPGGIMASVFPVDVDTVEQVLRRAQAAGVVEISNFNSPTQYVLSGDRAAVEAAAAMLEDEAFVHCTVIEERIPMHSSVFASVAPMLQPALEAAAWRPAARPYLPNVDAQLVSSPAPEQLCNALRRHVFRPVRWRESIDLLAGRYPDAVFVEVGPGHVLCNLLRREWHSNVKLSTDGNDLGAALEKLTGLAVGA